MFTISLREVGMNFDTLLGHAATGVAVLLAVLVTMTVMGVYWEF